MDTKGTVLVIGSGAAGMGCAKKLAASGWKVLMAERDRPGGTCLWRGCIPKKSLVRSAEVARMVRDADRFGVNATLDGIDWQGVLAWKWHAQESYAGDQRALAAARGVELLEGSARFTSPETVEVGGVSYRPDHVVIATGSEPILPEIPGIEHADTSEAALRYSELPGSLCIIGGGAIAMELAGVFASLGTDVAVLVRGERPLDGFDAEVAAVAIHRLRSLGVRFSSQTTVSRIVREADGLMVDARCESAGASTLKAERVLAATGRRPALGGLDLEDAGVEVDAAGHVVLDPYLRTTNPTVWCCGDAAGGAMHTPIASLEGRAVATSIDSGVLTHPDCSFVPTACFTVPELALVGMTEDFALKSGREVSVSRVHFDQVGAPIVAGETAGLVKTVADARTGLLLGAQAAGHGASDIIYAASIALRAGMKASELGDAIAVHPSFTEALHFTG